MSSTGYSAELDPDPLLRSLVSRSGTGLGILGLVTIAMLPWPLVVRTLVGSGWALLVVVEVIRLRRAWRDSRRLKFFADGTASVLCGDGEWRFAELLDGGILLRRYGWIRLRTAAGIEYAEPVRGSCRNSNDWRRLQVIWRHVGAGPRSC